MPPRRAREADRRRCAKACGSCKRRKERCDGLQPCQRCTTRGVGDQCSFVLLPSHSLRYQDIPAERNDPDPVSKTPDRDPPLNNGPDPGALSSVEIPDHAHPHAYGRPWALLGEVDVEDMYGDEESCGSGGGGSSSGSATIPELSGLVPDGHGKFVFIGDAANLSFLQIIRRIVRESVRPCVFTEDPLQHVMVEATPPSTSNWVTDILDDTPTKPPLEEAQYLLRWYVRATSCVLNLFKERELDQSLSQWLEGESGTPSHEAQTAIFFLIFAIGAQTCPDDRENTAERYFNYGRFLTTSVVMEDISIPTIQCNILITMYLLGASRRNAAFMYLGSAVRAAYALGIQRYDINKSFDRPNYLSRERIWKVLRVLDLFMSASLGRAPSTHETRDTTADDDYSASNDLCAIFEEILTHIYSRRIISARLLNKISQHHREWSSKFASGLNTDDIKPSKFIKTAEDQNIPNIGLCHLKGAYYWTIMLLTRPFLVELATKHVCERTRKATGRLDNPSPSLESKQVLAVSCVDSAIRAVDLLSIVQHGGQVPKCLPFVVNTLFVASLVLGLAHFSDLDLLFPLDRSLCTARRLLDRFSAYDAVARRSARIVEDLQMACRIHGEDRTRQKMERQSLLVQNLFGAVHDRSRLQTPADTREMAPEEGRNSQRERDSASLSEDRALSQSEQGHPTWNFGYDTHLAVSNFDSEVLNMLSDPSTVEGISTPSHEALTFGSFGNTMSLLPFVDASTLGPNGSLSANGDFSGLQVGQANRNSHRHSDWTLGTSPSGDYVCQQLN
ncbi:hypothetical protein LCI18_005281 [Fusarium solani-melongenae]|uniref:Uncharacterized protein n=1 Tax=Fusarium solani subsp. cucurbitae TaxID=2747967 RepID=A0ACD3YZJ4_FUSSC|nr:hypothetical protein LCI18_005281 [Fusarium solani-melongenae]